MKALPFGASC